MSKFCSNFGTLTYLELDILRKGLMLETKSVHQEYLTKARHVNDCTASIDTNENQVRINLSKHLFIQIYSPYIVDSHR